MRFLPSNEKQGSWVPKFMWTNFRPFGSLKTRVSGLGKNRIYGPHTEVNFHTQRKVPTNIGFMNRQKSLFHFTNMRTICSEGLCSWNVDFTTRAQKRIKFLHSLRGTLKQWFHESAEIVFGGCQNIWQFFLKQSLVHAKNLLIRCLVPLKRGFHDSEKLHFQASKIKKIYTILAMYLETLVSRIGRKWLFQVAKMWKIWQHVNLLTKLGILENWISRPGKIAFSGFRNDNYHTLCEVEWNIGSRIGRNRIYRPPKCRKYPNTSLGTHVMWISKFGKNRISLPHTEEKFPTLIKVS